MVRAVDFAQLNEDDAGIGEVMRCIQTSVYHDHQFSEYHKIMDAMDMSMHICPSCVAVSNISKLW